MFNILDNIGSAKKADHIQGIPGLEEFSGYCFKNHKCLELMPECHK